MKTKPMTKKADKALAKFLDEIFAPRPGVRAPVLVLKRNGSAKLKRGSDIDRWSATMGLESR